MRGKFVSGNFVKGKFVGGNMTGPLEVFCPQTCEVRVDEVADFRAKKLCFQGNVHVTSVCYIDKYMGINFLFPSEMPSHKPMILSKIVVYQSIFHMEGLDFENLL